MKSPSLLSQTPLIPSPFSQDLHLSSFQRSAEQLQVLGPEKASERGRGGVEGSSEGFYSCPQRFSTL
eukprot:1643838-Rhodomonas_salina.3